MKESIKHFQERDFYRNMVNRLFHKMTGNEREEELSEILHMLLITKRNISDIHNMKKHNDTSLYEIKSEVMCTLRSLTEDEQLQIYNYLY